MSTTSAESHDLVISVQGLSKAFGNLKVLEKINVSVRRGENHVVLGRSGSGKSVLIKILAGLLEPDEGSMIMLAQDLTNLNKPGWLALRRRVGFLFQGNALYDSMTVRENLEFPLVRNKPELSLKDIRSAVEEVLKEVGLLQTIDQFPASLSGGQKKRIGIARTLILKPEIIFYDEPTSGLDPVTCVEINELIRKVQQQYNTSAILITHDLTCARSTGDRISLLADGHFMCTGSFEDVFHNGRPEAKAFYAYNFIQ